MTGRFSQWFLLPVFSFAEGPAGGSPDGVETATFAGGCFWCIESAFDQMDGVVSAVSGYTGGSTENPTYEEVSSGRTGHFEAVQVTYDPSRVSYSEILNVFWKNIDPTDRGGQFADRGSQYRTAIFYHNGEQKRIATASKEAFDRSGLFDGPIATEILEASRFYPAEEYHQGYYRKNAQRYEFYKSHSGRERYVSPCARGLCPVPETRKEPGDAGRSTEDLRLRLRSWVLPSRTPA